MSDELAVFGAFTPKISKVVAGWSLGPRSDAQEPRLDGGGFPERKLRKGLVHGRGHAAAVRIAAEAGGRVSAAPVGARGLPGPGPGPKTASAEGAGRARACIEGTARVRDGREQRPPEPISAPEGDGAPRR